MGIQIYDSQKGVPDNWKKSVEKPFAKDDSSRFGYIILGGKKRFPIDIMPEYLIEYFERNVGVFDCFEKEVLEKFCPLNEYSGITGTVDFDSKDPSKYLKEYSKLWSLFLNGEKVSVSKRGILPLPKCDIESHLFEMVIDNRFLYTRQSELIKKINDSRKTS